ncbi:hypothetical protein BW730_06420 [Tessaracoccus aquimaris]|uniref:Uncharacterized protein n=1 Tax=Tessaracoccus aquimaris TaxID=1332264 RepID=A0A1Q2CM42_9ACTN|nr:hypothetical protein [Tessaracoccus aquimaris]AQP47198.1 hypothetical protein BW730_06420 [Tessaracoccus aquimaris]
MTGMLFLIGFVVLLANLGIVALAMWVGYRLVVSAIKRGILEADQERARLAMRPGPRQFY